MPDDLDLALARLAVDHGFLSREEATHVWQQIQAPGAPRFVQVLLQSGRLKAPEVERLRALWQQQQQQQQQGGAPAQPAAQLSPTPPTPPPRTPTGNMPRPAGAASPPSGAYARPSGASPPSGAYARPPANATTSSSADALAEDGAASWEDALQRDQQLARVLLSRSLTTQDRLRECRQLQLQHRMRLAPVLVKKGYVERAAVEDALAAVRSSLPAGSGTGRMPGGTGPAPQPAPMTPTVALEAPPSDNPFAAPAGGMDQDNMPTLNVPPGTFGGRPPLTPAQATPQDAIPTLMGGSHDLSLDELNPFGAGGPGRQPRQNLPNPVLSGDELDAFTDIPLQPLNQSARIVRGPGPAPPPGPGQANDNGPGGTGWGPGPGVLPETNPEGAAAPAPFDAPPVVESAAPPARGTGKKTTRQPPQAPAKKGGKGLLIALLLFGLLAMGAGVAALLYVFVFKR